MKCLGFIVSIDYINIKGKRIDIVKNSLNLSQHKIYRFLLALQIFISILSRASAR